MKTKLLMLFALILLTPLISANTFGYNYLDNQPSGNITNEYINNTYINQTLELNWTNVSANYLALDQTTPQTFTGGTVTDSGLLKVTSGQLGLDTNGYLTYYDSISSADFAFYAGFANYADYVNYENDPLSLHLDQTTPQTITATDTTITASDEIYFGDATDSFKIKKDTIQGIIDLVPSPDLSEYFKLDQTTPQTIINGAPKFTKSLIAAKTITDTSLIESFTFGDQAAIFQANSYSDYGVIFSAVGDHQYPLYNSFLKSRSSNGITRKAVKTGDQLGLIEFVGDTGTYYVGGAEIRAEVIATPGKNTMPTDLIFGTNFNASIIPERWRLTSIGDWVPKADNQKVYFGAAKDASITYNGTNLVINPKVVGTGILDVLGTLQTDGYKSSDGTAGWTGNCINASYKDGLVVGCND